MYLHVKKKSVPPDPPAQQRVSLFPPLPVSPSFQRPVLDQAHHDPAEQVDLREVVLGIVTLAQTLNEKQFYPYQVELAYRIVESLLLHDSETITALLSRQSGKTQVIGAIVAAMVVMFPYLALKFPKCWYFNITDDSGVYRGFSLGLKVGIYAPRQDQSRIMFDRVKLSLETDTAKRVLSEIGLLLEVSNGNTVKLSNGSRVLCETASENAKIEGETHGLLVLEEAQDISDLKIKKSLRPMISSTGGTLIMVGTATTKVCAFYDSIKLNERMQLATGLRNHFFFPYTVCVLYNSLYRKYIEQEKIVMGEMSDEFQTSYCCVWVFERGMFVTQNLMFSRRIAQDSGIFSGRHPRGFLDSTMAHYSVVAGIDWGSASDSTVITTIAVNWNAPLEQAETFDLDGKHYYCFYQKHILNWVEYIGDNYEDQFGNALAYLRSIRNLRKIVTDSNTCGRPIYDRLVAVLSGSTIEVEDFNFHAQIKSDGYKSLYGDLCGQRITFPASTATRKTGEYQRFIFQMLDLRKSYKNGLMCVAHPETKHAKDDYSDSGMLSAWGANRPSNTGDIDFLEHNIFYRKTPVPLPGSH